MARRRVRGAPVWRQLPLPGFEALLPAEHVAEAPPAALVGPAGAAGAEWETACYQEGCRHARQLAVAHLATLEAAVHAARPRGYTVAGWGERTLVTRFGDVRVRRRRYRAPDGRSHCLLDARLGWAPGQVISPALLPLLGEWAATVPFRTAARWLGQATAGVVSGSTTWRLVQRVARRVTASERTVHQVWVTTGALPQPQGERIVPVLYVEADGVYVKTQREPAHRQGCELKCASAYEGWQLRARPTAGHSRPHYRLLHKQVYCHAFDHRDASGHAGPTTLPFWDGVSLTFSRTYHLGKVPLVVVGGDGAPWIDGAQEVFHRLVRQRDGFHLARDAARGWGSDVGAQLYTAVRHHDQPTARALLRLPPPLPAPEQPARVGRTLPALPAPALPPGGAGPASLLALAGPVPATRPGWSPQQVGRARTTLLAQVATPDAGADWRHQVAAAAVPAGARALGTMEGTNAHLLAKRMKKKGMAWTVRGARHLAKVRELVTNGTLATWCQPPAGPPPFTPGPPRHPGGSAPRGPLRWPHYTCPMAHGPLSDPAAAHLHRIDQGGRHHLT